VLPMGRLRERRRAAQRADIIIVSKCPETISPQEKAEIEQNIQKYAPNTPIFFTKLSYGKPYFLHNKIYAENIKKVVLVAAIANPDYFLKAMQSRFECQAHFFFPDHHFFKYSDMVGIEKTISNDTYLLCTEKDAIKLKNILPQSLLKKTLVMPIEVNFLEEIMQIAFLQYLQMFLK
ncbi:MAG: tetraacyldisaccharide 4'-kinase, partial [Raineya sp.]